MHTPHPALRCPSFLVAALLGGALLWLGTPAMADDAAAPDPLVQTVAGLRPLDPVVAGPVVVVPLARAGGGKGVVPIESALITEALTLRPADPAYPTGAVQAHNQGDRAILVLGGQLLRGGTHDRLVRHDVLIPAGATVLVATLGTTFLRPAKDAKVRGPIEVAPHMAPDPIRDSALHDASRRKMRAFLQAFRRFGGKGEAESASDVPSLGTLLASEELAAFCPRCALGGMEHSRLRHKAVVGYVLVVGGRPHTLEVFASNAMMQLHLTPALEAAAFRMAALWARAETLGLEKPTFRPTDATRAEAKEETQDLLDDLRDRGRHKALEGAEGALGQRAALGIRRAKGEALLHDGRLIHTVLFVHDPYETAIFGGRAALDPAAPGTSAPAEGGGDPGDIGVEELERRVGRGTASEFEKRRLRRLRRERARPQAPSIR